jgi:DNA excision repair protein ERCC-2
MLDAAGRSVDKLADKIEEQAHCLASWIRLTYYLFRIKKTDASKLQDEYAKLVEGLQEAASDEDAFTSNPGRSTREPSSIANLAEL